MEELQQHGQVLNLELSLLRTEFTLLAKGNREMFEARYSSLRELMLQYQAYSEREIQKSAETYDERFNKNNEFREQLRDMIGTLARHEYVASEVKGLHSKIDDLMGSMSMRVEQNLKIIGDKIEVQDKHGTDKLYSMKQAIEEKIMQHKVGLDEKRDMVYTNMNSMFDKLSETILANEKNVHVLIDTNMTAEAARFSTVDKQMDTKIDANAAVSNSGIIANAQRLDKLIEWKENLSGSMQASIRILFMVLSFFSALVVAIIIYLINHASLK